MALNFQRGDFCPVLWTPTTTVGSISPIAPQSNLNIKSHSLDLEAALFDTTNTGSGGVRSRIAGPLDVSGTINADFDLDIPPYLSPPLIIPGVSGIAGFTLGPGRVLQVPTIIGKLHFESAVENEVRYSFDVKANSRVGFVVYPPL